MFMVRRCMIFKNWKSKKSEYFTLFIKEMDSKNFLFLIYFLCIFQLLYYRSWIIYKVFYQNKEER